MTGSAPTRGAVCLLIAAVTACASQSPAPSAGDAAFRRGDLAAAAAAYQAESANDPETLTAVRRLRLALALAAEGRSRAERNRARAILSDLSSDAGIGGEAAAVLTLVDHLATADEEEHRLAARLEALGAEVERCRAEVARLGDVREAERLDAARAASQCEELRERVADLESAVARRDAELAELRAMIEDLKHVDLDPEP